MHGRVATLADRCDFSQMPALIATDNVFLLDTVNAIMTTKTWTAPAAARCFRW